MRLIRSNSQLKISGSATYEKKNLLNSDELSLQDIRGKKISMILSNICPSAVLLLTRRNSDSPRGEKLREKLLPGVGIFCVALTSKSSLAQRGQCLDGIVKLITQLPHALVVIHVECISNYTSWQRVVLFVIEGVNITWAPTFFFCGCGTAPLSTLASCLDWSGSMLVLML